MALIIWVAAVVGAVVLSSAVAGSIHTTPAASSSSSAAGPEPSTIKSTERISLFQTANLERALAKARAALGANAQVDNFVMYPGYLSITAVKGSGEVDFYVDANGRVIQTSTGATADAGSLFRLSQVSSTVPAAIVHRIATRAHVPESQLHYVVVDLDSETHRVEWLVYGVEGSTVEYFRATGAKGPMVMYSRNGSTGPQPVSG